MNSLYLNAIRQFEGYTATAKADYAQTSIGYGTRARFAGETISVGEAERRFREEIDEAKAIVDRVASTADAGTKAALTSLTFSAGTQWIRSGLGDAVRSNDLEAVKSKLLQYNKAGGEVLPGLVSRRFVEASWVGSDPSAPVMDIGTPLHLAISTAREAGRREATNTTNSPNVPLMSPGTVHSVPTVPDATDWWSELDLWLSHLATYRPAQNDALERWANREV